MKHLLRIFPSNPSVRKHARNVLFTLFRSSGIPWIVREVTQRNKVTIVVYHAPSLRFATTHFQALQRRYHLIGLSDYVRACQRGTARDLPRKSLIITIDDGHKSNYALKSLLAESGVPVTIFLCSGIVGTSRHYWWTETQSPQEAHACKKLSDDLRGQLLLDRNFSETKEYPERQALSRQEVAEMMSCVDFQSHTVFHPILPTCAAERAEHEVAASKLHLEQSLGLKIYCLAFPNGDYTDREVAMAKEAGYSCAVTLDHGYNDCNSDLFRLRRLSLSDDSSVSEMLVKASGVWESIRSLVFGK